jgi:hypothetical protein
MDLRHPRESAEQATRGDCGAADDPLNTSGAPRGKHP